MLWIQASMTSRTERAVIAASRLHAPRVKAVAQQLRLNVLVVPSPVDAEPAVTGLGRWLPSVAGLRLSRESVYERIALAYYRSKGWL
jgi:hypothetical protein